MTDLIKDVLLHPFDYAFGAICVLGAVGLVIRFGRDVWEELTGE